MKLALSFLLCLCLLPTLNSRAGATGVSGKYNRFYTVNGAAKVVRDEYLDFQVDGRCVCRTVETDANGVKRHAIIVASFEVIGDYVEISGEFGFETYEIRGNRLVGSDSGYIKGTPPDAPKPPRKPAKKHTKHLAKRK